MNRQTLGFVGLGPMGSRMTKDVLLYLETAESVGVPRQVAVAVAKLWRQFNAACPGADFTFIHKYLEEGGDTASRHPESG